ncbi:MAG: hypothetical protein M3Y87_31165 [Myxococcota bacterium]|nr:hypothetical protein [Myxococcota bacterium]
MTPPEQIEAYLLGGMGDADAARFEDALFDDRESAAPVRALLALIDAARRLHAIETTLGMTTSAAALEALEARGKRVQRHTMRDGDRADAAIGDGVDLLVARLELDLARVRRVDLELLDPDGTSRGLRSDDVDVDHDAGCVWVPCAPRVALASRSTLFRLHAHREDGAVTTHDYVGSVADAARE